MKARVLLGFLVILLCACEKEEAQNQWVIKYKDSGITRIQLQQILPAGISAEDSTLLADAYIRNWTYQQLLLQSQKQVLTEEDQAKLESQIEAYRKDLYQHAIEEKMQAEMGSFAVDSAEIVAHIQKFPDSYKASEDLLQYRYIMVPRSEESKVRKKLTDPQSLEELRRQAEQQQWQHSLGLADWTNWNSLRDRIPGNTDKNQSLQAADGKVLAIYRDEMVFLLHIIKFVPAGQAAPFAYLKPSLEQTLSEKKKKQNIDSNIQKLYQKALEKNEIVIFKD